MCKMADKPHDGGVKTVDWPVIGVTFVRDKDATEDGGVSIMISLSLVSETVTSTLNLFELPKIYF